MKRSAVLSLLLILFGCAPSPRTGKHVKLPVITDNEMAGKVVVVRMSSYIGVLNDHEVAIDEQNIFYIGYGEYAEFALREGEHYITLKYFSGAWFEDTLKFVVKDSQTIYLLISPYHWTGAKIRLSNETEAKKHIERGKFINLKK